MKETTTAMGFIYGTEDEWLSYNRNVGELAYVTAGKPSNEYIICMADAEDYREAVKVFETIDGNSFIDWYKNRNLTRSTWSD